MFSSYSEKKTLLTNSNELNPKLLYLPSLLVGEFFVPLKAAFSLPPSEMNLLNFAIWCLRFEPSFINLSMTELLSMFSMRAVVLTSKEIIARK